MAEIIGIATITLKDELGTLTGNIVGARHSDFGDFLVIASDGQRSSTGELLDNQIAIGKIDKVVLGQSVVKFKTSKLNSAYSLDDINSESIQNFVESVSIEMPSEIEPLIVDSQADEIPEITEEFKTLEVPVNTEESLELDLGLEAASLATDDDQVVSPKKAPRGRKMA